MGYYIPGPQRGKGMMLQMKYGARHVPQPKSIADVPDDKALICVVDNGLFEAAGLVYSQGELEAFTDPSDHRVRNFFLMDREEAYAAAGYTPPRERERGREVGL